MNKSLVVSLIGRPNVGKSTIFNRLLQKQHKALTHDTPGVTRDRHYGLIELDVDDETCPLIVVDTGGFYPEKIDESGDSVNHFFNLMADHAKLAINESDLVLFVVDVRDGCTEMDKGILNVIRASKKPFLVLVNKWDSSKQEGDELDFFQLGISDEQMLPVSGAHALGFLELEKRITTYISKRTNELNEKMLQKGVLPNKKIIAKVALLGAPNVGKSTLLNCLLGDKRALVSDVAGTTVDPIEGYFDLHIGQIIQELKSKLAKKKELDTEEQEEIDSEKEEVEMKPEELIVGDLDLTDEDHWRSVQIVDTAGIRKQKKVDGPIETHSVYRSLRSISEAEIVFYMVDARAGINHQDRRLIDMAIEQGKSIIVLLNKYDLVPGEIKNGKKRLEWFEDLRDEVPWLNYCDFIPLSAKNEQGIKKVKSILKSTISTRMVSVSTSRLNQALFELIERHSVVPKRSKGGARLKLKYASQIKSSPPTFILYVNRQEGIPRGYRRYISNGIRAAFSFRNTPIHLIFRRGEDKETTNL